MDKTNSENVRRKISGKAMWRANSYMGNRYRRELEKSKKPLSQRVRKVTSWIAREVKVHNEFEINNESSLMNTLFSVRNSCTYFHTV
jgi:hypothetical protein